MGNYNLTTKAIQEQAERAAEGFPLLPKGKHLMRVKEATFKVVTNKETGKETDAIDLDLVVIAGEPCEHMQCRDTMFFSEKDRKSTRLNSSHSQISYAVFCLKKKKKNEGAGQDRERTREGGGTRL